MNTETVDRILEHKIIVVMRDLPEDRLIKAAEAMYEGGIRIMEVPFSASGKRSDEQTARSIYALRLHFENRISVGAGTVLTEKQVETAKNAGAEFAISPDTDSRIIKKTKKFGLLSIPGALTPTEIMTAHRCGADFIKLFPASHLGTSYIRSVLTPLDHIRLLAVGGIRPENIGDYLSCGVCGFGISSGILNADDVTQGRYDKITENAKKYTSLL